MRKHLIILYFFSIVFSFQVSAQNTWAGAVHFSSLFNSHSMLSFSHNLNITQTQPACPASSFLQQPKPSEIKSGSVKDLPFFCALECRLRGRTGLWLKLRTGDDASYEKLIRSAKK